MISKPINNPQRLSLSIRPIKIAYFLFEEDEAALTQIIRLACTQWGGLYNLIIPVTQDIEITPIDKHFLELHKPEKFVAYFQDNDDSKIIDLQKKLQDLYPQKNIFVWGGDNFEKNHNSGDSGAHSLGIADQDILKNSSINDISIKGVENKLIASAIFGEIYPGQEKDYFAATKVVQKSVVLGSVEYWESQLSSDALSSIINLTSYRIETFRATNSFVFPSSHFDIFIVNSVNGICLYWNSRATREIARNIKGLGRRSLLLPEKIFETDDAIENLLQLVRKNISYNVNENFTINTNWNISFSAAKDTWAKIQLKIENINGLELMKDESRVSHMHRGEDWYELSNEEELAQFHSEKLRYKVGVGIGTGSYHQGFVGKTQQITTFIEGKNNILYAPPLGFNNRSGGHIILDIDTELWKRFPNHSQIAKQISPEAWFSKYGLSIFAQTNAYPHQNLILNIPNEWNALQTFFENNGYEIRQSKTSQYSEALLSVMGGLVEVEFIATKKSYSLLELLEAQSTQKLAQKLRKELGVEQSVSQEEATALLRNFQIDSDIFRGAKPLSDLMQKSKVKRSELLQILQKLCELNVVKRGFRLDCPRCGTSDWYPLENISEQLICTGCSNRFMLPVNKGDAEISWHYRLSSLANQAMDQDILPAIYALYHLTKDFDVSCLNLGLEIHQQGETNAITDFDFLYISDQKIYAGECKKGTELGDKDLETASFAAQLGFAKFYFCTVKTFSQSTIQKIEERKTKIKDDGFEMSVEVLTEKELLMD